MNEPLPLDAFLDAGLREAERNRRPWNKLTLHVSDLSYTLPIDKGGLCPKQLWLRLHGYEEKEPSRGQRLLWHIGHEYQELLIGLIREGICILGSSWSIVSGVPVKLADDILGETDWIFTNGDTGEQIIVDCKTSRGKNFQWLDAEGAKPSHRIQVCGYSTATGIVRAIVFYADREGQNWVRQFEVELEDVGARTSLLRQIRDSDDCPPVLKPVLEIKENKGPNSIKLKQPWQCEYCSYRDISCDGALPKGMRSEKIVGHLVKNELWTDDEHFKPVKGAKKAKVELVKNLIASGAVPIAITYVEDGA